MRIRQALIGALGATTMACAVAVIGAAPASAGLGDPATATPSITRSALIVTGVHGSAAADFGGRWLPVGGPGRRVLPACGGCYE